MSEVLGDVWRAKSYCEPCEIVIYHHYPIFEDRRVGLHRCTGCNEHMSYTPIEQSEFDQIIWTQLTNSIEFYESNEPPVEIVLGDENA